MVETFDPTDDVPGIVDYERPDTWPQALTALLDAHAWATVGRYGGCAKR